MVAVLLALGCGGRIEGERVDGEEGYVVFDYVVPEGTTGDIAFDSLTTTQLDVSSHHGTLNWAEIAVTAPGGSLAILDAIEGHAALGDHTLLASRADGPATTSMVLAVRYHGDLVPYFTDGHHIGIHWHAHFSKPVPKGGLSLQCRVGIAF